MDDRILMVTDTKCIKCGNQLDKSEYLTADGYYKFGYPICNKCKEKRNISLKRLILQMIKELKKESKYSGTDYG